MKLQSYLFLLLVLLLAGQVQADVGDLYAAEVRVEDDSPEVRNQALGRAMYQVLVRLSGSADVAGHPEAGNVTRRASSLVQQFRYRLDDGQPAQRHLWAKFDKLAVDRLLRDANIPVWGAQRPRVLLWLAVERGGKRRLLNLETDPAARQALQARAYARGMPLQLPLMDLQDQAALSAADLWADYEAAIRDAAARYPHDVILSGRLRKLGGDSWSAQWSLWERGAQQRFDVHGQPWLDALRAGIDATQDRLAAHYAPAVGGDGPERLRVRFSGIDSAPDYGRLMQILEGQEVITQVSLRVADGEGVLADLWVRGGRSALARILSLGGELFLEPDEQPLMPMPGAVPRDSLQAPRPAADMRFRFGHPVAGTDGG